MRQDMVLYSECEWIVYLTELMIPFHVTDEVFERKKLRFARSAEDDVHSFVGKSTTSFLFSFQGQKLLKATEKGYSVIMAGTCALTH